MNEFATVAMLRSINGKLTAPTKHLHEILDSVSRTYQRKPRISAEEVEEFENRILYLMRNEVPRDQSAISIAIAKMVWHAINVNKLSRLLSPLQFSHQIHRTIENNLSRLTEGFIQLHDDVLDVNMVHRILEGKESFDPDKIWVRRDPGKHDRYLRKAVNRIARSVVAGIYHALQEFKMEDRNQHRKAIIRRGVKRGIAAHGRFDAGAIENGGYPAMLRLQFSA